MRNLLALFSALLLLCLFSCKKEEDNFQKPNPAPDPSTYCNMGTNLYFIVDSCKINSNKAVFEHHSYADYITLTQDCTIDYTIVLIPPATSTCYYQRVDVASGGKTILRQNVRFAQGIKLQVSGVYTGKKGEQIDITLVSPPTVPLNPYSWIIIN